MEQALASQPEYSHITETSWTPPQILDLQEWVDTGETLGRMARASQWWIGDWLNYGSEKFPGRYKELTTITGLDAETLYRYAEVAAEFMPDQRHSNLSWSHHREVLYLPTQDRESLLNQAIEEQISVHKLRGVVKQLQRGSINNQSEADGIKLKI